MAVVNDRSNSNKDEKIAQKAARRTAAADIMKSRVEGSDKKTMLDKAKAKHAAAKQTSAQRMAQTESSIKSIQTAIENRVDQDNEEIAENDEIQSQGVQAANEITASAQKSAAITESAIKTAHKNAIKPVTDAGKKLGKRARKLYKNSSLGKARKAYNYRHYKAPLKRIYFRATSSAKYYLKQSAIKAARKMAEVGRKAAKAFINAIRRVIEFFSSVASSALSWVLVIFAIVFIIIVAIVAFVSCGGPAAKIMEEDQAHPGWEYLHYEVYNNPVEVIAFCEAQYARDVQQYLKNEHPNQTARLNDNPINWNLVYKYWMMTYVASSSSYGQAACTSANSFKDIILQCNTEIGPNIWQKVIDAEGGTDISWPSSAGAVDFYNSFLLLYYDCETDSSHNVLPTDERGLLVLKNPRINSGTKKSVNTSTTTTDVYPAGYYEEITITYYNSTSTSYESNELKAYKQRHSDATGSDKTIQILRDSSWETWTPKPYNGPITSSAGASRKYKVRVKETVQATTSTFEYYLYTSAPHTIPEVIDFCHANLRHNDKTVVGENSGITSLISAYSGNSGSYFTRWLLGSTPDSLSSSTGKHIPASAETCSNSEHGTANSSFCCYAPAYRIFFNQIQNLTGVEYYGGNSGQKDGNHALSRWAVIVKNAKSASTSNKYWVAHLLKVAGAYARTASEGGNAQQNVNSGSTSYSDVLSYFAMNGIAPENTTDTILFNFQNIDHYLDDKWEGHGISNGFNAGSLGNTGKGNTSGDWCAAFATYLASSVYLDMQSVERDYDGTTLTSRDKWDLTSTIKYWDNASQSVKSSDPVAPASNSAPGSAEWFYYKNRLMPTGAMLSGGYTAPSNPYLPKAGDYIFFAVYDESAEQRVLRATPSSRSSAMRSDGWYWIGHVGIVVAVDNSYVYALEGNASDTVRIKKYALNSWEILAYGLVF